MQQPWVACEWPRKTPVMRNTPNKEKDKLEYGGETGTVFPSETHHRLPQARNKFTYDISEVPGPKEANRRKKGNMEKGGEMNAPSGKD